MMKLLHRKILQKVFVLFLFLQAVTTWGQTISRGIDGSQNTITGITVTYNGVSSCSTSANPNVNLQMTLTAQAGYSFKITSISGTAVRSSSGKSIFSFQLLNNGTVNGTTNTISGSSNCGLSSNATVPALTVPTANQTVTSGNTATINIVRGGTGGGYSHMRALNVEVELLGPPSLGGNATQTFTYGTAGSYTYTLSGDATVSATLNPSGSLPAELVLDTTNKRINVANNTPAGTYNIILSATNSNGTDTHNVALTVNKRNQTISGFNAVNKVYGEADFNLTATGGDSGEPITYTSANQSVATVSTTGTVTIVGVGTSSITASQAGNDNYNAASLSRTLTVGKANQVITGLNNISKTIGDADFNLTATGGGSGEPVTYTSSNQSVATIVNNTVTIVGAGTTTITASQAGNDNYNAAANVQVTLTVGKIDQTITGLSDISKIYGDASFTLTATGGASGEPVTYASSDPTVASITNNTVTILKPGTVEITASQAGNTQYNAASDVVIDLAISAKPITITGAAAQNKVYEGNPDAEMDAAAALTASEIVGSDDVALSATYTATFNNSAVGTAKPITATYSLTGADAAKYTLTQPTGLTANITAKELTITGISVADKVHDGTTTASITGTASLLGIVGTEDVNLDATAATAVFTSAAVGAAIPVTISGYTLTGADIANYTLTQPQGLTANITSASLANQTITFGALANTTYGASFSVSATASSNLTVTFGSSDTNIATVSGNTVTIVGVGPVDIIAYQTGNGSYNPAPSVAQPLTISPKELTVTGASVDDKTYDQGVTAQVSGTPFGIINNDAVTLVAAGEFTTASAGNNKAVTAQFSITGNDAAKYTLTQPTLTGNILPATLMLDTPSVSDKVYDGTTAATVNGTLNGVLSGDTVTLNGTGTFASEAVGSGIAVTSTATLGGTHGANYSLTQPTGLTANITAANTLTFDAAVDSKIYNKTAGATITISNLAGFASGDDVSVTATGAFDNENVGNNKSVVVVYALTGADAANYTTPASATLTGSITAKDITVDTATTSISPKQYDGNTNATVNTFALVGVVPADSANVLLSGGTFAQATPGTGIAVNNFTLSGTAASNYTLTQPATLTGTITQKQITMPGAAVTSKVYDGTTDATITGTLVGVVPLENVTYTGTGTYASANAGSHAVTPAITIGGTQAGNYIFQQPASLTGTITKKPLTVTFTVEDKVYDQSRNATLSNVALDTSGIIAGDDVSIVEGTGTGQFSNFRVADNISVAVTGFTLEGDDAGNYTTTNANGTADITKKDITADISAASITTKVYDKTTTATITGATLVGAYQGDTMNIRAIFSSVNVGENIPVTLALQGATQTTDNYNLVQPTPALTGIITKRMLTATAQNKTKVQGAANPALTIAYSNFVGGDTATNSAGYIAPQIATDAITSSPAGAYPITLTGGAADNYDFTLVNGWLEISNAAGTTGQLLAWDFFGESNGATSTAEIKDSNLDSTVTLSRGSGASASAGNNSFRTVGFMSNGISVSNSDYFQFAVSASNNYKVSLTTIYAKLTGTSSFSNPVSHQFAYSINGGAYTLIGSPTVTTTGTPTISVDVSNVAALQNVQASSTITFRYYASGATNTGGWGFYSASTGDYGLSVSGTITQGGSAPAITSALTKTNVIGDIDTYQITATGTPVIQFSATGLPAGAAIDANGLISFDGTTPAGIHNITIKADSFYGSNQKTLVYTVTKKDQDITLTPDPLLNKFANDPAFTITMVNNTGVAVTWDSSDTAVATVDQNGEVTPVAAGTATISVSNNGNSTYNAINKTLTLTVLPVPSLNATPAAMNFTAVQGQGASAASQVTAITGTDLYPAAGDITLTASTGFEVIIGAGSYASTGNVAYTGGVMNAVNPQIFVRLAAGAAEGNHTGTLTIAGGNATTTITLSATVDAAPEITTTAAAYGPYCFGTDNNVSIAYTTQGTFGTGNFYAQYSDENGAFPSDLSNTGTAVTASPATVTLPSTLAAGNYRVRVIHLSSALVLTSSNNNNGTDIVINNTTAPTATALTFCGATTVANLTANGTALKWYAAANGGSELASTDNVTTGDYFVSQTLNGCESARTQVAVTVNVTTAPVATALTFCGATTVANLTANGTALKWYAAANGGTELAATDNVTTGDYFVSQTLNGCESARTQVAVTVNVTTAPVATALTFCGATTVANLTANGTALKWYAAANGGTELASTDNVTTGDYFVSQTLNGCESARTQVAVTVNNTTAPTATALTFCGATTVANLTANGTALKWYAAANGGTELASTDNVTTGDYFVSQTLNGCESARTQVAVTVNVTTAPVATALTFCGATTVANLTANGTALKWYATANGGSELASTDNVTTGNYFVSQTLNGCESARTQVAVTVNNTTAPTATALTFCGATTVANLTANGTALKWYAAANGGTELASTDNVTTGDYFVSQTLNGCESARTQVAVTVNVTTAPVATALTFCGATTVANLTANGTALKWYAAANGGSELASTDNVTTGNYFVSQTLNGCESARTQVAVTVNVTTAPVATALTFCGATTVANLTANGTALKWYAAANGGTELAATDNVMTGNYFVSQTLNGCESARTQVAVTVNNTTAPTATALTFCGATTVANLTANGTALKWYAAANGGTELASTDNVTTGDYFVSQTLNGCESARTQVAVTVNNTIAPTATALTFCGAATVANLTANGTALKWYAAANGGTELASTDNVTTGDYFVSQTLNGCESARTQVAVTVNVTTAPTATALTFCGATTVANLTANGTALKWYAAANGGSELASTDNVTTGDYFVSQTLNGCESARTQVAVTVNVTTAPVATALTFCGATTVANLTANGTALKWYAAANGGSELASTDNVTTGDYFVSQTLNGCESARTQVAVTVNVTTAPVATALTFCGTTTVANLTANGTALKWYAAANGGTELASTDNVTTGDYFVSQTLNGCESARTQVAVTVGSAPVPVADLAQTLCNGNTIADIVVDGTNLTWYHNAFGNQTYATTTVLTNGTYYVSQTIDGCESTRVAITVALSIVVAPGVIFNQTHCGGTLVSALEANGTNLKWYNSASATVALDDSFVLTTGTYYVSQTIDGCESQRAGVHITINTTPAPTGNTVQSFTAETTVNDLEANGENVKWYLTEEDAIAGENSLSEDYILTDGATYYATQTINGCESNATLAVTVSIVLGYGDIERFTYKFYPNPVTDKLYLESNEKITQVTVYSLSGQVVINEKWNTQSDAVNMASLEAGTYIVTIKFGNKEKTVKVIRNK